MKNLGKFICPSCGKARAVNGRRLQPFGGTLTWVCAACKVAK